MSLNMGFPILEVFVPLICFCVVILCCNTSCRALQRAREERQLQQNIRDAENPSVFIIPFPNSLTSDDDPHRPPRYSIARSMSPPPPYNEVEMKPPEYFIPEDAPPPPYVDIPPPPLARSAAS